MSNPQIPLMENKMKWDRPKKKKKYYPNIEIEMTDVNYLNIGNAIEEESSSPIFQTWYGKKNGNLPSPNNHVVYKEQNIYLHSGDSGIESVKVCVVLILILKPIIYSLQYILYIYLTTQRIIQESQCFQDIRNTLLISNNLKEALNENNRNKNLCRFLQN